MLAVMPVSTGSPCASCKLLYGATCCEAKGEGPAFPMSYGEASRIARHLKSTIKDSVDIRKVGDDEKNLLRSSAGVRIADLVVGGRGLYLPRSGINCAYLRKVCSIKSFKPYLCATFPFKRVGKRWVLGHLADTGFCFVQDTVGGTDAASGLKLIGETTRNLDGLHAQWERDTKSHAANMKRLKK